MADDQLLQDYQFLQYAPKTISILLATIITWRCIGEVHDSSVLAGALSLSTTVVLRVTGAEEKA